MWQLMIIWLMLLVPNISHGQVVDSVAMDSNFGSQINPVKIDSAAIIDTISHADTIPLPTSRPKNTKWWVFLFGVFILIAVGILKNLNPTRHKMGLMSYWLSPKAENEIVEYSFGLDAFLISQIGISCLILGWLAMLFLPFDLNFTLESEFSYFLLYILGVTLIYSVKFFIHYIVGLILQVERISTLIVYSQVNMLYTVCMFIFPCLFVYYYAQTEILGPIIKTIVLILIGVHIVFRWLKSFRIYFEFFPYAKVYIFIYLCALEILPLLVIIDLILLSGNLH